MSPLVVSYGMGLTAWLTSDDTGMSSKYLAAVLSAMEHASVKAEVAYPWDAESA